MKMQASNNLQLMLVEAWVKTRREWLANVRLRWGVRFIFATIWLWLALLVQEKAAAWHADSDETQAQIQRLKPLRRESNWPQRADDARAQLETARALLWTAASQGQAEAMLQDRLRDMCAKAGLNVRELVNIAGDTKAAAEDAKPLRVRLVVDMGNRLALMGLLSEIGQSPQLIIVDTLRLRPQASQARAELEVRVLYREQVKVP